MNIDLRDTDGPFLEKAKAVNLLTELKRIQDRHLKLQQEHDEEIRQLLVRYSGRL